MESLSLCGNHCFQSLGIHRFEDVREVETVGHGLISTGSMKLRLRYDKCLKWCGIMWKYSGEKEHSQT
jgi:hypothetical protein